MRFGYTFASFLTRFLKRQNMARLALSMIFFLCVGMFQATVSAKVYELRTYNVEAGRQADALKLMADHGVGSLKSTTWS